MTSLWILYNAAILAVLVLVFIGLIGNLLVFRSLRRADPPAEAPFVSILVPARNEEHQIGKCVASLKAQDFPRFEVLVLDDHSDDQTARIVRELGFGTEPHLHLFKGEPLPKGWTGKAWACHQLAARAGGDYLLFTDTDTIHAPGTVSAAVAMARDTNADLLSPWPRLVTVTWGEKLVIPMIHLFAVAFYPHVLMEVLLKHPALAARLPRWLARGLGAANGQFLLFRRDAYDRIGRHAAIRSHMVEDVALGREVSARMGEGMRLVNCDASGFVECRMYTRFAEVWEGFTKNMRPAFENAPGLFFVTGLLQVCCLFAPFVFILLPLPGWGLVAAQVGCIYVVRAVLAVRFRSSWLGAALHPVGHGIAVLIALNSWRKSAGAGVSWKGRVYRVRAE